MRHNGIQALGQGIARHALLHTTAKGMATSETHWRAVQEWGLPALAGAVADKKCRESRGAGQLLQQGTLAATCRGLIRVACPANHSPPCVEASCCEQRIKPSGHEPTAQLPHPPPTCCRQTGSTTIATRRLRSCCGVGGQDSWVRVEHHASASACSERTDGRREGEWSARCRHCGGGVATGGAPEFTVARRLV